MSIFEVVIILILFLTLVYKPIGLYPKADRDNNSRQYLIVVGVILILISGLRKSIIGLDTYQYVDFFKDTSQSLMLAFKQSRFEPGYTLLNILLKSFDFIAVQIAVSSILIFFSFRMVRKYSPVIWLSCLLFIIYCFYYRCFNEMRQAVALGFICLSFDYIIEKKIFKYLVCLVAAATFHQTSLIFLSTIILMYIDKIRWWQIVGLFLCTFGLSVYANYLIQIFLPLFRTDYSGMDEEAGGWGLLMLQVFTFVLSIFRYNYLKRDRTNIILIFLMGVSVAIFPICHINPMLFRLEDYFWIFMILLVPRIMASISTPLFRYTITTGYLVVGYFFYFTKIFSESNQILPFRFFWE